MKRILTLVLAMAMVLSLAACSTPAAETPATESPAAETPAPETPAAEIPATDGAGFAGKKIALIVKATGNPYNERQADGFVKAIEELGAEAIIKAPDAPTVEAQMAMVEELIVQQVDGIAIAGNDFDALQNVLKKAMDNGIEVVSLDSAVNAASRQVHVNQADSQKIGETLIEAVYDIIGGSGQFAILSATSQAANQNIWIQFMQETLKDPKYAELDLVTIAYGDDLRDKSTTETEGLIKSYPDLKCIVAPTAVGLPAAAKVLEDQGLADKIKVTGLGLPSEMAAYIDSGTCPYMYLWNPIDVGYLAGYTIAALSDGTITGAAGDTFPAGTLGEYTVTVDPSGGTEVLLGAPFKFEPANINDWKDVY